MGDINRDLLNNQIKNVWTEYMEPFGLTQLVSEATRVTSRVRNAHLSPGLPTGLTRVNPGWV